MTTRLYSRFRKSDNVIPMLWLLLLILMFFPVEVRSIESVIYWNELLNERSAGSDYEGIPADPQYWPEPTHFIAPSGSDDNSGTTSGDPWGTFEHAVRQLKPGDVLGVMDGKYYPKTTGLLHINGGHRGNAMSGLPDKPITVRAVNERVPILKSDGLIPGIYIARTRYWNILGLTVTGEDKATDSTNTLHLGSPGMESVYSLVEVNRSNRITLKRILASHSNRLGLNSNNHIYLLLNSSNVLVEESEAYLHHRHAFIAWQTENITFRRNYIHPREHYKGDMIEEQFAQGRRFSDEAIAFYRGSWGLVENCINEGTNVGFHAHGGDTFARNLGGSYNEFYGNIGLNNFHGSRIDARRTPYIEAKPAIGNKFVDFLVIGQPGIGLWHSSATDNINRNITLYGGEGTGFRADSRSEPPCQEVEQYGGCTFTLTNTLAFNNKGYGISVIEQDQFLIEYANAWNNAEGNFDGVDYSIASDQDKIRHSKSVKPVGMGLEEGECIVFVPEDSNMKGAGKDGDDIGANILYRYKDGKLTNNPLWNAVSGEFPHGALVEGINDLPGESLFDVHKRLNVNHNGCWLPYSEQ